MLRFVAAVMLTSTAATAQGIGYAEHDGVRLFTEKKCGEAISAVFSGEAPAIRDDQSLADYLNEIRSDLAIQGMAWGFILGFDTASGGLHEGDATTLERLRQSCAESPEKTAFEILDGFSR